MKRWRCTHFTSDVDDECRDDQRKTDPAHRRKHVEHIVDRIAEDVAERNRDTRPQRGADRIEHARSANGESRTMPAIAVATDAKPGTNFGDGQRPRAPAGEDRFGLAHA